MINEEMKRRSRGIEKALTPRLLLIAEAAKGAKRLADIGTDHAYIPVYMVLKQGAESAIAADINKGPLMRAEENIKRFGLEEKIKTRLSDGLKNFGAPEADTVIVAGMGGTLIAKILDDSPKMKKEGIRFVLQPMTAEDELRRYLEKNGYKITDEFMTREGDKLYTVILAEVGEPEKSEEEFYHVSKKLFEKKDELFKIFLDRKINEFQKVVKGLSRAEKIEGNIKKKDYYEKVLMGLLKLKGECDKW